MIWLRSTRSPRRTKWRASGGLNIWLCSGGVQCVISGFRHLRDVLNIMTESGPAHTAGNIVHRQTVHDAQGAGQCRKTLASERSCLQLASSSCYFLMIFDSSFIILIYLDDAHTYFTNKSHPSTSAVVPILLRIHYPRFRIEAVAAEDGAATSWFGTVRSERGEETPERLGVRGRWG